MNINDQIYILKTDDGIFRLERWMRTYIFDGIEIKHEDGRDTFGEFTKREQSNILDEYNAWKDGNKIKLKIIEGEGEEKSGED